MHARFAGFVVLMAALLAFARVGTAQPEPRSVRRGAESVTIVGERDGWTEIVLRNGKRALVPSSEVEEQEAPHAEPPTAARAAPPPEDPRSDEATPAANPASRDAAEELRAEVGRLRDLLDELAALKLTEHDDAATRAEPPPRSWLASESLAMLGLALLAGVLIGGAMQRQRARRSRSLRF